MSKATLAVLAGATLLLATPAYAVRGGGAGAATAMSGAGLVAGKADPCRQRRCENARRKPRKIRREWFAEGLDPLIR